MVSDRNLADAVGGKSARACDNCGKKRASWYCAADDAFLCQPCDSSVHSANPLARRHERVRLKTASSNDEPKKNSVPAWHRGFTRKPRTPRQKKRGKLTNPLRMVPEMCSEEQSLEESEEQVLVPIFDPFEISIVPNDFELDLGEFDVERFLEDEPFDMEGLGLLDCHGNAKELTDRCLKMVKFEDEESGELALAGGSYQIDIGRETFELNFDYDSTYEEEDERKGKRGGGDCDKRLLKLDYEGVLSAWDHQKSPWTTGERPVLNPGDFWPPPDCSGTSGAMHGYGETGTVRAAMADGGREARVSRYREKRRTRLFSKKIRYEVRKLNAEKRPRMKGRFVKRANFAASAFPVLNK